MATINPRKFTNNTMNKLAQWLISNGRTPEEQAVLKTFGNDVSYDKDSKQRVYNNISEYFKPEYIKDGRLVQDSGLPDSAMLKDTYSKTYFDTLNNAQNLNNISDGVSIGQLGKLGLGAASAHPLQTAGGALTTGMNLAGLTDNDKFGGQIGGLALGGLASYGLGLNPGYAYLATTAGGALGSLFDKLRAKREAEAQQAQMYRQAYR